MHCRPNRCLILVLFAMFPLAGCGSTSSKVSTVELSKMGFAFASLEDSAKKGPATAADLQPFLTSTAEEQSAYGKLRTGKIVFLWGATTKGMTAGPSNTVLAYGSDVPKSGGLVLFGSGEVREQTAAQFAAAPKGK